MIRHLIKKYFRENELVEMREELTWGVYARMNDEQILNILKHRFTNLLAEHYSQNEEALWIAKGRMFECFDLIENITTAEEKLLNITKIKAKERALQGARERIGQISLNKIKSKLTGFKKQKKKPENL